MRILFSAFLLLFSCALWADDSDSLIESLKKINTYKAHFNQRIRDNNGEKLSNTKGEMMVKRPGKFYWKSQAPDPILVVADGENLWTYDIELSQVTKQDLDASLGNSPAALLAGNLDSLKQNYTIASAPKSQCSQSERCYELKPRNKEEQFSNIYIGFTKENLVEIRMKNALGQDIYTRFTQVKINPELDNKLFAFKPPKGVDVIQAGT